MTENPPSDGAEQHDETPASGGPATAEAAGRDLRDLLNKLALAGLVLLALVAGLRFYLATSTTIDRWVVREYRSLFHATFNLALLLLAGYGISVQVRRLR